MSEVKDAPKTLYFKSGSMFSVHDSENVPTFVDRLPPKVFNLLLNPLEGFKLESVDDFELPPKLYGSTEKMADRFMSSFEDRDSSTGVILSGEKGSGKTLLAKKLAMDGISKGYPVILINSPYGGGSFSSFIQQIDQPTIVMFDEFEKVYSDNEKQDSVLTLFDGTFSSKKLFVVTCNDKYKVSDYMFNRPGRFFYSVEFKGLEEEFIREFATDTLRNQEAVENLVDYTGTFNKFNFDMLKALVEEMNRFGEDPVTASKLLNINNSNSSFMYDVEELEIFGVPSEIIKKASIAYNEFISMDSSVSIVYYVPTSDEMKKIKLKAAEKTLQSLPDEYGEVEDFWTSKKMISFNPTDLVSYSKDIMVYRSEVAKCVLRKRKVSRNFDRYDSYMDF